MDSLTQLTLGAAVGVATMGRRTALWKAALVGGLCGTLPDLDVLIPYGDPISDMTFHRAHSHALFWLSLLALPLGAVLARGLGEWRHWRRWGLAVWLALVTHPLLDVFTIYGTQLLLPFTDTPLGLGSVFVIDPLYTLPLLAGLALALKRGDAWGLRANQLGLLVGGLYLAWGVGAQAWVRAEVQAQLRGQGIAAQQVLVTAAPFTTLLWQVVVIPADAGPGGGFYLEGTRSLLDAPGPVQLTRHARGDELLPALAGNWHAQRLTWFSRGFWRLTPDPQQPGHLLMSDLRMGFTPYHNFTFRLLPDGSQAPQQLSLRLDLKQGLGWLWRRIRGEMAPLPLPGAPG